MNPLRCATLVVTDLAAATVRYAHDLGYRVIESGTVDADLAARWAAPAQAGSRYALLRPASGRPVDLRLVARQAGDAVLPLRTHGWAAIELCVQDTDAIHAQVRGGDFEVIGPPKLNPGLPDIYPMQVSGPDGEVVYLTQVLQGGPDSGLPRADSAVDVLFIAVLGCADMQASADWVSTQLGLPLGAAIDIPYRMINRAYGLPADQRHRLVTATQGKDICLEFDQYPAEAQPRPRVPGHLPPGIAIITVNHPDLDAIPGPWLVAPARAEGALYEGRRAGLLSTPEGALIEVLEAAP